MDLNGLPEFGVNPFDGKTHIPIYEIARVTSKTLPDTFPPYKNQQILKVVGRSPDKSRIYFTSEGMLREDNSLMAVHGFGTDHVDVNTLEKYEVLVSNSKLTKPIKKVRKLE